MIVTDILRAKLVETKRIITINYYFLLYLLARSSTVNLRKTNESVLLAIILMMPLMLPRIHKINDAVFCNATMHVNIIHASIRTHVRGAAIATNPQQNPKFVAVCSWSTVHMCNVYWDLVTIKVSILLPISFVN